MQPKDGSLHGFFICRVKSKGFLLHKIGKNTGKVICIMYYYNKITSKIQKDKSREVNSPGSVSERCAIVLSPRWKHLQSTKIFNHCSIY